MPWQHLITSIHIEECSWECIRGHRNAYWIWWTSNIWLIHEEFRKVFLIHWFLCFLWCHHIRGVNWKGAFSADTGCITVGAPAIDVVEAMVERLCRLVSHRDGAKFSKRCSLELLKQDLPIKISAGGFNCRKFQVWSTTMLKSGEAFQPNMHLFLPCLLSSLRLCWLFMEGSPHLRKGDLNVGRPGIKISCWTRLIVTLALESPFFCLVNVMTVLRSIFFSI